MSKQSNTGSRISLFRQVPTREWIFFSFASWKNVVVKNNVELFLCSKAWKCKVFQDVFLHKNSPTPEQSQEPDSTCKSISILCSLQFSWNGIFCQIDSSFSLETEHDIMFFLHAIITQAAMLLTGKHMCLPCTHGMAGSWNHWKCGGAKCWLQCVDYNCFGGHFTVIVHSVLI